MSMQVIAVAAIVASEMCASGMITHKKPHVLNDAYLSPPKLNNCVVQMLIEMDDNSLSVTEYNVHLEPGC